jgi:hypothetical protein
LFAAALKIAFVYDDALIVYSNSRYSISTPFAASNIPIHLDCWSGLSLVYFDDMLSWFIKALLSTDGISGFNQIIKKVRQYKHDLFLH